MSDGSAGFTWPNLLADLIAGHDLSTQASAWAMEQIMGGFASPAQIAGFLVAMAAKGESVAEVRGIADTMLLHARPVHVPQNSLDIVGTGGDKSNTVNISTMAAIVAAATGITVVKHGNRASSSKSGTADCLEALGVDLTLPPSKVAAVAQEAGITFCFAQVFHPSMTNAAAPRRELGIATIFNVLGPLTNPAQPQYSVIGVAKERMVPVIAGVLAERGTSAAVCRGDDGLDELTLATTSRVLWVRDGQIVEFTVDPIRFGIDRAPVEALRGGDAAQNAEVVWALLRGRRDAVRDAVALNAGLAVAVAGRDAHAVVDQATFELALQRGVDQACEAIDSGAALATLEAWRAAATVSV
ncbi:anthranilate phosphoribosyltransferase [Dermatophilus congolensis]|uniref:Anthranilate phosphoribosyltransferase n=1 Tax=Dermatophilus congolensis TaxID=1863 RepID=A0A239VQC7_9MICO|nr:anthranilate phosphoribosyltransferase [Dermatophilus congolensis]MBO3129614.1 anthranilate phosphoribosyltransferase [Dermatophilus congolensis]MBO3131753.1 anthranilate phosphoribosyltransferase [Dermatophilus congolensis]MBO3134090.1 anthranilate phosphoribosyltransferase [Dermatophilus congolensis]MBO3136322.1 anthranilate phosphoribosyltransferase [Dermatophilus congolensis]MBO3138570.1 anthranilate phosphoribosyltransferase [Dermatophilus congolensis]